MLTEEVMINNEENDCFGIYKKARVIIDFLVDENKYEVIAKNNMMALYGNWGSGKSSLLKTIAQDKNINKNYKVLNFDTCKYENTDSLACTLLEFIIDSLDIKIEQNFMNKAKSILTPLAKSVTFNLGFLQINAEGIVKDSIEKDKDKKNTYYESIKNYNDEFKKTIDQYFSDKKLAEKKILVFIDDLDRCNSENILSLLSALKNFLSIDNRIIFLCTIDNKAVELSLTKIYGDDSEKSKEFLEKIFPISFSMPNKVADLKKLIALYNCDRTEVLSAFIKEINFNNPRRLKKIMNKYAIIKDNLTINTDFEELIFFYLLVLKQYYEADYLAILNDRKNIYLGANNLIFYKKGVSEKDKRWWDASSKSIFNSTDKTKDIDIFWLVQMLTPIDFKNSKIQFTETMNGIRIDSSVWLNEIGRNLGEGLFYESLRFFVVDRQSKKYLDDFLEFYGIKTLENIEKVKNTIVSIAETIDTNY